MTVWRWACPSRPAAVPWAAYWLIGHAAGQPIGDAQAAFDLAQRQHATVRGALAATEAGDDGLAAAR